MLKGLARPVKWTFVVLVIILVIVATAVALSAVNRSVDTSAHNPPSTLEERQIVQKDVVEATPTEADVEVQATQKELVTETPTTAPTEEATTESENIIAKATATSVISNAEFKRETRAIWARVGRQPMRGRNGRITPEDIDALVNKVDTANLNVILLSVYSSAAYFEPSHTRFPNSDERLPSQTDPAFAEAGYRDALSYLLAVRDQRRTDDDPTNDFEVHAWFNVHRGGEIKKEGQKYTNLTEPFMLHAIFPEFRLKSDLYYEKEENDLYINHEVSVIQQPRFRAYMVDLIAGLVEDYDVDGIHLDHIRTDGICFNNEALDYPGDEYDYPGCQEDYKVWTLENYGQEYTLWEDAVGFKEIEPYATERVSAWLEDAVGTLVKAIHDEVKIINPEVIISVASVRNNVSKSNRNQLINGQTAWTWLDEGWIDAAFIISYSPDTSSGGVGKISQFREAIQNETQRNRVFPGLATHNVGDDNAPRGQKLEEQINAVMFDNFENGTPLTPPAKGVALFLYRSLSDEDAQMLGNGPFKEPARPFWGK